VPAWTAEAPAFQFPPGFYVVLTVLDEQPTSINAEIEFNDQITDRAIYAKLMVWRTDETKAQAIHGAIYTLPAYETLKQIDVTGLTPNTAYIAEAIISDNGNFE